MLLLPYLNNRQAGTKRLSHFNAGLDHYRLNLDSVLSRFVSLEDDAITVWSEESEVPPFASQFRRDTVSELLAFASEEGDVFLYDTRFNSQLLHSFAAHNNAIFDICWLPDKCQMLTASGDYTASLWDMKSCNLISSYAYHSGSVKSVDVCNEQSAMFATGSRDGSICVWDSRENGSTSMPLGYFFEKPSISIKYAHNRCKPPTSCCKNSPKDTISSISSVVFQNDRYIASAGAADGGIKIWDLRKTYLFNSKCIPSPVYHINYSEPKSCEGCTSLVFDSSFKKLYACCTSGNIFQLDCHNYSDNVIAYKGFTCATYFVKMALSPDDQYLLCGSSDRKAYIWKTSQPGYPILELPGHTEEVTSVAWNPHNISKLTTCGDDNKVLIWKVGNEENEENKASVLSSCTTYTYGKPLKTSNPKVYFIENNSSVQNIESSQTLKKMRSLELLAKRIPSTSQDLKKPVMKEITSFFTPVASKPLEISHISNRTVIQGTDVENSTVSSHCLKSQTLSSVLTPSKILNKDNILSNVTHPNIDIVNKTVDKNISMIQPELCKEINKENSTRKHNSELLSNNSNVPSQTKRKLSPNQSSSKCRKTLSSTSSKAKGHGKKAKKEKYVVSSIKNYFLSI